MTGGSSRPPRPRQRAHRIVGIAALVLGLAATLAVFAPMLGLIDSQAVRMFGSGKPRPEVAAVYLSGDMGFRFGIGQKVASALAAHGIPVIGVSSAVAFASHRTRAESEAIVAGAIRTALEQTGARRIVLMGQSFGSDIVATVAPDLPPGLRTRIAAIVLVVPSRSVFFRVDPTTISYHGTPDADPTAGMRGVGWTPVVCIYGVAESNSLCPALSGTAARVIALPGGHFLHHDDERVISTIVNALRAADPTILQ